MDDERSDAQVLASDHGRIQALLTLNELLLYRMPKDDLRAVRQLVDGLRMD